jgi:hypothetical protein
MERANRWRGVALAAVGLFAGSILGPPVVQAATNLVTIQGSGSTHKAKVNGTGELMVNGETRPLPPASSWFATEDVAGAAALPPTGVVLLTGPVSSPIDVTSVSISLEPGVTSGSADIRLMAAHVPSTATSCAGAIFDGTLWHLPDVTAGAPFAESFPTPLQLRPASGTKACLFAHNLFGSTVTVNAVGFIGG